VCRALAKKIESVASDNSGENVRVPTRGRHAIESERCSILCTGGLKYSRHEHHGCLPSAKAFRHLAHTPPVGVQMYPSASVTHSNVRGGSLETGAQLRRQLLDPRPRGKPAPPSFLFELASRNGVKRYF
jgi:hypothetical protein